MLLLNLKWLYERLLSAHLLYRWLYFYLVSPQRRNNKNTILQFLLCALRVPLKCSSVTYPAIVPCNPSRSELLTTSEWLHVLWPLTSSLGYHFWCFFQYFFPVVFPFFYFFSCHSDFFFFSELWLTLLGCIPRTDILTSSFISHVQLVGSDNSFHSEKYCFREISFKTQQQLRLLLSVAIPKKYQLPTCLNSNQHLQVMAPDTLWYKMLLKTHDLALLFR